MQKARSLLLRGATVASLISLVVSACASSPSKSNAASAGQAAAKLQTVSLRFGFVHTGIDAIYTYGEQLGYFKQHGIKLDLEDGKGSAATAETVGNGSDDFGTDIDGGTFLTLAAKGLPDEAILGLEATSGNVIVSPAAKPITTPQQLVGKTIAIAAGDGPSSLLPALLQKNGIPVGSVHTVSLQPGPKLTALLTGRVDGVATLAVISATLAVKGLKTYLMRYADFGVPTPGEYVVTSSKLLRSNPSLVRNFVAAVQESMKASEKDPRAAAASFVAQYPGYNLTEALGELQTHIGLFVSPGTQGHPLGWMSAADADAAVPLLQKYGSMPKGANVSAYITNQFVPGT